MWPITDLVEFLQARYDELEAKAQAATEPNDEGGGGATWYPGVNAGGVGSDSGPVYYHDGGIPTAAQDEHIAANDPRFVLADVAAKRAIVAECAWTANAATPTSAVAGLALLVLRLLAAPFTGHPQFRDEWRVTLSGDLVARLTRVLDEEEAAADAILFPPPGQYDKGWQADRLRAYADRTMRMVAAHRRILDLHQPAHDNVADKLRITAPDMCRLDTETWPCETVRALAKAYDVA